MTPQQFGQLALQLLSAAQIPGEALDQAIAFREIAHNLAVGKLDFVSDDLDRADHGLNQA